MVGSWLARALVALLALPTLGVSASAGAQDAGADARRAQVLVEASGITITVGQVEDLLAQQAPTLRARYADRAQLKELVENMLRTELLAREAERRGYDDQPAVRYTMKESAAQALIRLEVEEKLTPESIPADEVRAYYEAHPAEFHRPAMRRASQILLDDPAEATRLLPDAKRADARGFSELAKQHSKDAETRAQGGDLGYFARTPEPQDPSKVGAPIREAAFRLAQVGDTTATPITLGQQHVILRLTGERPERHVSLENASPSIRAKLWRERRQEALDGLYARLRARDKPQVFTDRIYAISFDDMEKRPTGFAPDPRPSPPPSPHAAPPAHP